MPVEVANTVSSIGIFFAGLGILLASFGLFWFVSVYLKIKSNTSGISQYPYSANFTISSIVQIWLLTPAAIAGVVG